jgi:TRAP-type mannitol/chloroaromatic compound transport system permease small subunit
MLRLSHWIDVLNERIGKIAAWAIVAAVIVSTLNAIVRKLFGTSSNVWLELQWYLFGAVFMLCAAWTLKDNEHIRIDILSSRLSKRGGLAQRLSDDLLLDGRVPARRQPVIKHGATALIAALVPDT